ncbi:multidrug resistance-associated protein 4-like [Centruroides sculpturatus]|uniref:multidrug resistance-associated protein 4-like n=1 Tax=Centruroides sculpturatus TaxID=218467 RepID=UPI000C6D8187|nr:multidrug resistance-associated protein 4-like [Centruroides sculpturatus]
MTLWTACWGLERDYLLLCMAMSRTPRVIQHSAFLFRFSTNDRNRKTSSEGMSRCVIQTDVLKNSLYSVSYLVTTPFLIITTIAILWQYYGWTILVGYSVIFLFIPIQLALGKLYSKLRLQAAILGDERLNLLNEIIADMRLIKMYTWELPYSALLKKIRVNEMKKVRLFLYAKGMSSMLAYPISKLFTSLAYLAFFFNGGQLNAEIAFITMTVSLYIFMSTVSLFSQAINNFAEILVSLKRLQNYKYRNLLIKWRGVTFDVFL